MSAPTLKPADDLKTRAISARKAMDCCTKGKIKVAQRVLSVLDEVLEDLLNRGKIPNGMQMALAVSAIPSAEKAVAVITRTALGSTLAAGTVVLFAAGEVSSLSGQIGALEALSGVSKAIHKATQVGLDECENCIRENMWGQDKPQFVVTKKVRPRRERTAAGPADPQSGGQQYGVGGPGADFKGNPILKPPTDI